MTDRQGPVFVGVAPLLIRYEPVTRHLVEHPSHSRGQLLESQLRAQAGDLKLDITPQRALGLLDQVLICGKVVTGAPRQQQRENVAVCGAHSRFHIVPICLKYGPLGAYVRGRALPGIKRLGNQSRE